MRMTAASFLIVIAVAAAAPAVKGAAPHLTDPNAWRLVITVADRPRLRGWREAWLAGLDQARAGGAGDRIAAEGVLLDPDAALEDPTPPDGDYLCRTIKLGRRGDTGPTFAVRPTATCRLADGRLEKTDGAQRPSGLLWHYDGSRLLFLGAMALGDEPRALSYGRDYDRDMLGLLERIGPARWRLVLPRPHWESVIDVVELVPAAAAPPR